MLAAKLGGQVWHRAFGFSGLVASLFLLLFVGCGGQAKGPGQLSIESTPSGATVFVDGVSTGQVTPVTIPNLEPGVVTVRLETTDEFWQQEVTIEAGRTTYVNATLTPLFVPPDPPI